MDNTASHELGKEIAVFPYMSSDNDIGKEIAFFTKNDIAENDCRVQSGLQCVTVRVLGIGKNVTEKGGGSRNPENDGRHFLIIPNGYVNGIVTERRTILAYHERPIHR